MSDYSKRFQRLLNEQPDEISDQEAMAQTLEPDTNPTDFDVDAPMNPRGESVLSGMQRKMVGELKTWIQRLDDMSKFLNGTDPSSMQSRLKSAEPDTIFDKISTAENKKIARVAVEISSLSEMLKGYAASASDAKFRGV